MSYDVDVRIRKKKGAKASPPRLSARPLEEEPLPPPLPSPKRKRSFFRRLISLCCLLCIWGIIAGIGLVAYYGAQLPPIDQLSVPKRPPNVAILAEDGTLIANRGDTGGQAVRLEDLPDYVPHAFVAIEDRRFYTHFGIDPFGILRAASRNLVGGGMIQGGSTLTQQLAKNLFLTQERTASRKIQEAILALWLERTYNKPQILELYLNRVYFGSGAYGIEAASQKYFHHPARQLTLSEAAMLAGLMKSPTKLAPNRNLDAAIERAAQVIQAMAREGFISEKMKQLALANPAKVTQQEGAHAFNYVADYVMDLLDESVGAIDQDITVQTSLNLTYQTLAEQALVEELDRKGEKFGVSQGAFIAIAPDGQIKALVGGRNYSESQFNRAVSAHRQPGSAFKPFVYLTALEKGLTPDTIREDAPISLKGWSPENASRQYLGPVTLTKGLAMSLNTVAVRLGLEMGPKAIIATAHRLGISSDLQPNISLVLGSSEVTPLELVTAYVPFSNGGIGVQPHLILRVKTAAGNVLYTRKYAHNGRVIDPTIVAMMNHMLQETLLTGTARKADLPSWQAGGKTGTTQEYHDAWFVGYTSALTAGVWLGNDDSSPTKNTSGSNLPVEIWSRFMKEALKNTPPQPLPGGSWQIQKIQLPLDVPSPTPLSAPPLPPATALLVPPPPPSPRTLLPSTPPPPPPSGRTSNPTDTLLPPALIPEHTHQKDR